MFGGLRGVEGKRESEVALLSSFGVSSLFFSVSGARLMARDDNSSWFVIYSRVKG